MLPFLVKLGYACVRNFLFIYFIFSFTQSCHSWTTANASTIGTCPRLVTIYHGPTTFYQGSSYLIQHESPTSFLDYTQLYYTLSWFYMTQLHSMMPLLDSTLSMLRVVYVSVATHFQLTKNKPQNLKIG